MNPYIPTTSLNKTQINKKKIIKGHGCFLSDNHHLKIDPQYLYAVRLCHNVIKGTFFVVITEKLERN